MHDRASDAPGRCREALLSSGYGGAVATDVLGFDPDGVLDARSIAVGRQRARGAGRLGGLLRLFLLGDEFDRPELDRILAPASVADWTEAGLLVESDGRWRARWQLTTIDDLVLASDWTQGSGFAPDHVPRVSAAARLLANATVRRPGRRALDLCAGGGVHALLAARHHDSVVAVDVNPRAIELVRFNATLNGVTSVRARIGDASDEAVATDECFDLVVSLPPYVVGPRNDVGFLGPSRDVDICAGIVEAGVRHLEPEGWFQMLMVWPVGEGGAGDGHPPWLDGLTGDAILLRWPAVPIELDAAQWLKAEGLTGTAFDARLHAWTGWAEQEGVTATRFGLLTVRGGVGRGRHIIEDAPERVSAGAGDDLARRLDLDETLSGRDLANLRVQIRPDTRWTAEGIAHRGLYADRLEVRKVRGLEYRQVLDVRLLAALLEHPGALVSAVVDTAARNMGADAGTVAGPVTATLCRLIETGLVELV